MDESVLPTLHLETLQGSDGNAATCVGTIEFNGKTYVIDLRGKVTGGYYMKLKEKE